MLVLLDDRYSFAFEGSVCGVETENFGGEKTMLWTIFLLLLVLWALGFGLAGIGPLIHTLLVVAVIVLLVQLITGRRAV